MAAGKRLRRCVAGALMTAILPTQVCGEQHRFEKLMEYFQKEDSNIDFMVSSGHQAGPNHPQCEGQSGALGIWDLGSAPAKYEG